MGLRDFIERAKRVIKLSRKPTMKEVNYGVRMSLLAILILGVIAFIIRIIFWAFTGF
ncbi:MAG: protein translocase SEC61 complex subunit gamma [Promethearchaeota archaeon]